MGLDLEAFWLRQKIPYPPSLLSLISFQLFIRLFLFRLLCLLLLFVFRLHLRPILLCSFIYPIYSSPFLHIFLIFLVLLLFRFLTSATFLLYFSLFV
jgi:hypothetical protein